MVAVAGAAVAGAAVEGAAWVVANAGPRGALGSWTGGGARPRSTTTAVEVVQGLCPAQPSQNASRLNPAIVWAGEPLTDRVRRASFSVHFTQLLMRHSQTGAGRTAVRQCVKLCGLRGFYRPIGWIGWKS